MTDILVPAVPVASGDYPDADRCSHPIRLSGRRVQAMSPVATKVPDTTTWLIIVPSLAPANAP